MLTLSHIEDYLELIAGHRNIKTGKLDTGSMTYMLCIMEPPIKLARYDENVLSNMVSGIQRNLALTDKQAALACKIILKYRRQWQSLGVNVDPVANPEYRIPPRSMDYTKSLTLNEQADQILIKFPFEPDRVNEIREFSKYSQGATYWNKPARVWQSALTEFNLNWLVSWAQTQEFAIDQQITKLFDMITDTEHKQQPLELQLAGRTGLIITDASESMLAYFTDQGLTMHQDHILQIIDKCAEVGVSVHDNVIAQAKFLYPEFDHVFWDLCLNREVKTTDHDQILQALQYADVLQRWPVVIYEPNLSHGMLELLSRKYKSYWVAHAQQQTIWPWHDDTRYVYSTKPVKSLNHIPLLISTAGMTFGGDKSIMLQKSSKIVYSAMEVYRGNMRPAEVKFLAS